MTILTPDQLTSQADFQPTDLLVVWRPSSSVLKSLTGTVLESTLQTLNDARYAVQSNNLSDLASASTARSNLGLGTAAVLNTSGVLQPSNNLSEVASPATARTNLGFGSSAGQIGELITTTVGPIAGGSGNVCSVSLTAGVWDVEGNWAWDPTGSSSLNSWKAGLSTTSNTLPAIGSPSYTADGYGVGAVYRAYPTGRLCLTLGGTTTVYLVFTPTIGGAPSSYNLYGSITARRVGI